MTAEDSLARALTHEADRIDVDVPRLYVATQARVATGAHGHRSRRRPSRAVAAVAVAAAVVVMTGVLAPVVMDRLTDDDDRTAAAATVDQAFSCPVRRTTSFTDGSDDDSFLPELTADGVPAGEAMAAPRYEVVRRPDSAVLRLGNADGTLASRVTFRRSGGRYERIAVTKCSNEPSAAASTTTQPLLTPGLPSSPSDFTAGDFPPGAARVVDRLTYDVSGLVKRQSIWAYPCGGRLCLVSGNPASTQMTSQLRGDGMPTDRTDQLSDPDDVVGIEPTQRLIAVYDTAGTVSAVSWTDRDGATTPVRSTYEAEDGRLFLVLVPTATFDTLVVTTGEGPRTFSLDAIAS